MMPQDSVAQKKKNPKTDKIVNMKKICKMRDMIDLFKQQDRS